MTSAPGSILILRYSDDGLAARPAFFAPYNDLTIIVEDTGKENFYTRIMNRLLQGQLRITQVLGVGGKRQVIQRFESRGGGSPLLREFYLVDGDFDELLERISPPNSRFYRLRRYDIESFLIEEVAICMVAEEESPGLTAIEYRDMLWVDPWMVEVVDTAHRLAACAALLQELDETQTGISQSIERYIDGNAILPDRSKIESNIKQVSATQSVVEPREFDRLLEQMVGRMGASNLERIRWVSGKDILIPLVIRLLRQYVGRSLRKESLCFRLARNCDFSELAELRDRILAMA